MDVLLAVIADRWHWEMTTPSLCQPVKTHTGHAASSDGIYTRGEENPLLTNPRGAKCNHFLSHRLDMK